MTISPTLPRRGFTIIELALTAFLLSIGLLSVFALVRRGLTSRAEMEDETRGAAFAQAAFNSLRAASELAIRHSLSNDLWLAFWHDFESGQTNLLISAGETARQSGDSATDIPDEDLFRIFGDDKIRAWRWQPSANETNITPTVRYQCSVSLSSAFKNREDDTGQQAQGGVFENFPTNRAQITLHVWPRGQTNSPAQTYFSLFPNPGRLP